MHALHNFGTCKELWDGFYVLLRVRQKPEIGQRPGIARSAALMCCAAVSRVVRIRLAVNHGTTDLAIAGIETTPLQALINEPDSVTLLMDKTGFGEVRRDGPFKGYLREFYPIGEQTVTMKIPDDRHVSRVELLKASMVESHSGSLGIVVSCGANNAD